MKVYTVVSREVNRKEAEDALRDEESFAYQRFQQSAANAEYEYEGSVTPEGIDEAYLRKVLED